MATGKILKYVLYDAMRSRVIIVYAFVLLLIAAGLIYIEADPGKTTVSLLNIVLLIVPLMSIILATIYFYNSREFTELIMAQPIPRSTIFTGQYLGFASILSIAFLIGIGLPLLANGITTPALFLLLTGILLTFIFVGLAFLASVYSADKAKGIGISLILWFYFAVVYDGIILAILYYFNDYPLDKPILAFTALNPIDLSRVIILMKLDISALMGYTGALYSKFFGTSLGVLLSFAVLILWMIIPAALARRKFARKDF